LKNKGFYPGTVLALYKIKEAIMSSLKEQIREIEKEEIIRALKECDWVMAKAARQLGITERMIGYKIKKYGIRREAEEKSFEFRVKS
jgi:Nif-specific regulatory protein